MTKASIANIDRVLLAVAQMGGTVENETRINVPGCTVAQVASHIDTLHEEGMVAVKTRIATLDGLAFLGISITTRGVDRASRFLSPDNGDDDMKVFLSWSGEASRAFAEVLQGWLPTALPPVMPWMSTDITKGVRQDAEIAQNLEETSYCIVCVTPGVQHAPWVNYEAGAISKFVDTSYVSPLLLGVSVADLADLPLARFQCTEVQEKDDVTRLLRSINDASEAPIPPPTLERNVTNLWPALRDQVNGISLSHTKDSRNEPVPTGTARHPGNELHEIEGAILLLFADDQQCLDAAGIAAKISKPLTRTQHHIDMLYERQMLMQNMFDQPISGGPPVYRLGQKGRAYLVDNDLVP